VRTDGSLSDFGFQPAACFFKKHRFTSCDLALYLTKT